MSEEELEVPFIDEPWGVIRGSDDSGTPLLARIYTPPPKSEDIKDSKNEPHHRPAILDVHGGTWSSRDRTLDHVTNSALARAGFVVVAIDFRQGPTHQHPSASQDVVSALIWLREKSSRFGVDPNRIGILGTSSGGHLAMLAALTPNALQHRNQSYGSNDLVVDPPSFIMALWPVSDPLARYDYAKRVNMQHLVDGHNGYFGGSEENMSQASIPRIVNSGEAESLPPLLLVQPGNDKNVPQYISLDLIKAWQGRDGYLEYSFFPNEPHAFGLKNGPATRRLIEIMVEFARRYA